MINFEFVASEEREYAKKLCLSTPHITPGVDYRIVDLSPAPEVERHTVIVWELFNAGLTAYSEVFELDALTIHVGPYTSLSRCIYEWNKRVRDIMKFTPEWEGIKMCGVLSDNSSNADAMDYLYID